MVAVTGAVLAGGKGVRLGTDKALLRLDGGSLLTRVVATLSPLTDEVLVIGRDPSFPVPGARSVSDIQPGAGALGGVYTALVAANSPRCLVVACDMPFLNPRLLSYLVDLSSGYDVVVPRIDDWFEPMHAVYAKSCLQPIESLLRKGTLRILDFFAEVRVRYVDKPEVTAFDPESMSFFNINTPEQLAVALERIKRMEGRPL